LREKAVLRSAAYFVPIEPPGGGLPAVSYAVKDAGGNEQLFADWRVKHFTVDFEFDVTVHRHHNLIGRMRVIFPGLAGRISPYVATEASGLPVGANGIDVYHINTASIILHGL
jgi:hypothetical protein